MGAEMMGCDGSTEQKQTWFPESLEKRRLPLLPQDPGPKCRLGALPLAVHRGRFARRDHEDGNECGGGPLAVWPKSLWPIIPGSFTGWPGVLEATLVTRESLSMNRRSMRQSPRSRDWTCNSPIRSPQPYKFTFHMGPTSPSFDFRKKQEKVLTDMNTKQTRRGPQKEAYTETYRVPIHQTSKLGVAPKLLLAILLYSSAHCTPSLVSALCRARGGQPTQLLSYLWISSCVRRTHMRVLLCWDLPTTLPMPGVS